MKKKKKELQQEAAAGSENTQNAAAEVQPQNGTPESSAPAEQNAGGKKKKKPIFKRWWFWVLIIIIVIVVFSSLGGSDEESTSYTSGDDETEFTFESMTVMDNDEVSIVVTDNVYVVNKTDSEAMFSIDDAAVNGYMCEPYWADSVNANCSAFDSIYFYTSSLEEIGITDPENEIETIEFVFKAYDSETYDSFGEETVTLNP